MKLFLILTPGFPENESDTTCLPAFQQFALALKNNYPSCVIKIIAFQYPFKNAIYNWHGIEVFSIGGKNKAKVARVLTWLKAYRRIKKVTKNQEVIGILSLWLTECSLIGQYFSNKNHIKHFSWIIGQDAKKTNQYVQRIKPKGDHLIAMSDFLKQEFYKNHQIQIKHVVENGLNENSFPELNTKKRKIDILGVGSLIALKNYDLFIEIIFELKKQWPLISAAIAGIGENENALKQKTESLGLSNNITFLGLLSHTEVLSKMNDTRIFLHTSNYEGNSTVLIEALYSGCICFSTQPLSNMATKNLHVVKNKFEFVNVLGAELNQIQSSPERVNFNSMDTSARKIMQLYLH